MFRTTLNRLVLAAVVATSVLSLSAKQSEAGWGWWRCGWNSYYSPCYVTAYQPVICAPVVYRSSCYSPVCCYSRASCWGGCYSPCVYTCYDPCYSYGCDPCGYSSGVVYEQGYHPSKEPTLADPQPTEPDATAPTAPEPTTLPPIPETTDTAPAPAPAEADAAAPVSAPPEADAPPPAAAPAATDATEPPPVPGPAAMDLQTNGVTLAVNVPEDAAVYVNGRLTRTPGTHRRYVSRGLAPGYGYTYKIRAVVNRDGKELSDTRVVHVRAGDNRQMAFNFDQAPSQDLATSVPTTLMVQVPEDAEVTLEGRATDATGTVRRFTTNELDKGEKWEGYNVVVKLDRDGRVETRQKTINLIGGQSHELSFDFAPERLAMR